MHIAYDFIQYLIDHHYTKNLFWLLYILHTYAVDLHVVWCRSLNVYHILHISVSIDVQKSIIVLIVLPSFGNNVPVVVW